MCECLSAVYFHDDDDGDDAHWGEGRLTFCRVCGEREGGEGCSEGDFSHPFLFNFFLVPTPTPPLLLLLLITGAVLQTPS